MKEVEIMFPNNHFKFCIKRNGYIMTATIRKNLDINHSAVSQESKTGKKLKQESLK